MVKDDKGVMKKVYQISQPSARPKKNRGAPSKMINLTGIEKDDTLTERPKS